MFNLGKNNKSFGEGGEDTAIHTLFALVVGIAKKIDISPEEFHKMAVDKGAHLEYLADVLKFSIINRNKENSNANSRDNSERNS